MFFGLKAKTYQAEQLVLHNEYKYIVLTKKALRNMFGWDIKDVIRFYKNKYKDRDTHVENHINKKIKSGEFIMSENNELIGINYRKYSYKPKT